MRLPPSLKCFPLCKPKRHGYNQHHLTCRARSYSSCSHTRLLTYSHRALHHCTKSKSSSHTRISIVTTSKEMSFNPLHKQSANHHRLSTSSKKSPMPVLSVMNMLTPLLKSQPPPTPTLQTPPSKQQALREIPSTMSTGLQKKTEKQAQTHNHTHTTNMAHSFPPKLWYLPNHRDALQAHMHLLHKLGIAKAEANYHAYYQTLIKNGTANRATSNAYLTSSYVPLKTK